MVLHIMRIAQIWIISIAVLWSSNLAAQKADSYFDLPPDLSNQSFGQKTLYSSDRDIPISIYKSVDDVRRAIFLLANGDGLTKPEKDDLVSKFLACTATTGTIVIPVDGKPQQVFEGYDEPSVREILLFDGRQAGCMGYVLTGSLR